MRSFAQFLGQGDELSLLARYLYLAHEAPIYEYIMVTRARLGYFHGDVSARKTRLHVHAYPVVTHAAVGQGLGSSRETYGFIGRLHYFVGSHYQHGLQHEIGRAHV